MSNDGGNLHEVEINLPYHKPGFRVTIDGQEIRGIRDLKIELHGNELPVIKLEILAKRIFGNLEAKAEITEITK